jgi:hypothetical protein
MKKFQSFGIIKPLRKLSLPVKQGNDRGGSLSGFFCFQRQNVKRGHNPPLDDVDATESDKRVEQGLYLLLMARGSENSGRAYPL